MFSLIEHDKCFVMLVILFVTRILVPSADFRVFAAKLQVRGIIAHI